jgi:hypothetical protein
LGVALLLVIVVMREAGQPQFYETFFATGEQGWVSADGQNQTTISVLQNVGSVSEDGPNEGSPTSAESSHWSPAEKWVDSMDLPLQRAWIQSLVLISEMSAEMAGTSPGDTSTIPWAGLSPTQINVSAKKLEQLADSYDPVGLADALRGIEQMRDFAGGGEVPADFWQTISPWATEVLDALDQTALARISDGTFWTGADSDSFYLQLARANELPAEGAVSTGTLPLLQQPDIYRGQRVRLVGTLQLAQRQDAKPNRLGIENYWKVWMIPDDGGIRPTIFMTPQLPQTLANSLTEDGRWDARSNAANPNGQFAAVGRFIKRLPYRSSVGADLAPVVIGRVVATRGILPGSAAKKTKESDIDAREASDASGMNRFGGLIFAVLGGIALAGVLMYRVSIDAKRSRRLRRLATENTMSNLDDLARRDEPKRMRELSE